MTMPRVDGVDRTGQGSGGPAPAGGVPLFRTLLISFCLIAALSCGAIGVMTYVVRAQGIRAMMYSQLETVRDEKTRRLAGWFDERMGDVSVTVVRPDVVSFCKAAASGRAVESGKMKATLSVLRAAYSYEAVFLAGPDGKILATTETLSEAAVNLPLRREALMRTIEQKRTILSDVLMSKIHKKPTMFLFTPVMAPGSSSLIGVLGILVDPAVKIYPRFTRSKYLGETGEIFLVNSKGLMQSPLKFRAGGIATTTMHAEPATRGAAGEVGRLAVDDYRPEPVMAAYGHIDEFGWGIVVKKDIAEINRPVAIMARNVLTLSLVVLLVTLVSSYVIARRIARPALAISEYASRIGSGDLALRVPVEGPSEIRRIAVNLNSMVALLSSRVQVAIHVTEIMEVIGRYGRVADLLGGVLPSLMQATRSQLGVVFIAGARENILERALVHGMDPDRIASEIAIAPPDHVLALSLKSERVEVLPDIPPGTDLALVTQAGEHAVRTLLSIPLIQHGRPIGVVGLASLYDYSHNEIQIATGVQANLAQAIEIGSAFARTEDLARELDERNVELTAGNEELRAKSDEMEQQADELRQLAVELEQQREQVAGADRLKSEFLSAMSHELRTPLNNILALSELMLANGVGKEGGEDAERIAVIERSGRRLLSLINDILDLSKIESGRMETAVSSFAVADMVMQAADTVRHLIERKGVRLVVDVADVGEIRSDRDKLSQILLNLLSNAEKFTDQGEVRILARREGDGVSIAVRDTGIGIPAAALPHIFDEFRQVDGSTTKKYGGTGLGLAISRRLATLLGGTIEVKSELGHGTTFTFRAPVVIPETARQIPVAGVEPSPKAPATRLRAPSTGPLRILVVEDDEVAGDQVRLALEGAGFVVARAPGGAEALASVRESVPDGVVLDLMMPGIDGFEVLKNFRSTPETEALPVLILSAKDLSVEERSSLKFNNIHSLIQKGSVNRDQLIRSVRALVGIAPVPTGAPVPAVARAARVVLAEGETLRVLMVDDNADSLGVVRAILGDMNASLFEATDGRAAVEMARTARPHLIVMDIEMPLMNGMDAAREIKGNPELRDTVIIALTARAMRGDREEILAAGCDDYLSKPVSPSVLRETIARWVAVPGDTGGDG